MPFEAVINVTTFNILSFLPPTDLICLSHANKACKRRVDEHLLSVCKYQLRSPKEVEFDGWACCIKYHIKVSNHQLSNESPFDYACGIIKATTKVHGSLCLAANQPDATFEEALQEFKDRHNHKINNDKQSKLTLMSDGRVLTGNDAGIDSTNLILTFSFMPCSHFIDVLRFGKQHFLGDMDELWKFVIDWGKVLDSNDCVKLSGHVWSSVTWGNANGNGWSLVVGCKCLFTSKTEGNEIFAFEIVKKVY